MLDGTRVVDRTTEIAGPYCTKLLADAGAEVVSVGPVEDSGLYEYLHSSKRVDDSGGDVRDADVLVVDEPVDVAELWSRNPALVVVTITPFGCEGPWAGRPATEFTLQAACGSTATRGLPENPPLAAGGRLGEWLAGTYAAVGAIAALRSARRSGVGEHVDVAMFDCMAVAMTTFQPVFSSFMGHPPVKGTGRAIEVPSIEPTADDYVVFTTNSAQQFESLLLMMGRADLVEDKDLARPHVRFKRRDEFSAAVHAFTVPRPSAQVLEEAATWRIPAGPVLNGETVTAFEQFVARGVFGPSPSGRFRQPRVPYRIAGSDFRASMPNSWATTHESRVEGEWGLPLTGVRILDCTAWWAGPAASHVLACLGDVIKVESAARPDLMRFTSTKRPGDGAWWEWGPLFHSVNVGKRGVTLDLMRPEGVDVFERLLGSADAVLENYTPRVMEQFGLGWDRVHEVNPRAVMVRMPAFGLDGPWRDRTGFAQTMECIAGMAWVTGFPDGPPVLVRGACDPLAGVHAAFATMLALAERDRRGEGMLVEAAMVEAAVNVAAEQVIEFDTTGTLLTRNGNRSRDAAPQGVYQCAGDDRWVALSVANDEQWRALVKVLGGPAWADGVGDRAAAHDAIDAELAQWFGEQNADAVAELLSAAGVPAEVVLPAVYVVDNPQIQHRRLYEDEDHPVTGTHPIPGLPFRFTHVDRWARRPSPTIGEHNDEVLGEVASPEELEALRAKGVIGEGLAG
jgi:crotonobetainyl-CoA:carnitine CoA-transferase CaiB-like acyl-CoA transferase